MKILMLTLSLLGLAGQLQTPFLDVESFTETEISPTQTTSFFADEGKSWNCRPNSKSCLLPIHVVDEQVSDDISSIHELI